MRRSRTPWIVALLLALLLPAAPVVAGTLPPGTIQAGTLANGKLVQDTMVAVMSYVGAKGCNGVERLNRFVTAMPAGAVGSREWHERWIVHCGGGKHTANIRFNEDGLESAFYTVRWVDG